MAEVDSPEELVAAVQRAAVEWALLKNGNEPMSITEIKASIDGFGPYDCYQVVQLALAEPSHAGA